MYLFDRDHKVFEVQGLRFVHEDLHSHLKGTLIDGEMDVCKVNGATWFMTSLNLTVRTCRDGVPSDAVQVHRRPTPPCSQERSNEVRFD